MDIPASTAVSVNDALQPLDVKMDEMPMTPDRIRDRVKDTSQAPRPADD
jgi:hypothetical protein